MDPIGRTTGGVTATMPLRVFLSHTSDLGKHTEPGSFVAAAVEAVLRARHAVTDMAYFGARDSSPAATCVEMVAQSDVYVGIIGLRYGSPVWDRPDVSYTELEFEAAGEHERPRLIFLIREDSAHVGPADELSEWQARQDTFRRRLRDSGLTVVRVDSPAELELAVYQALVELGPTLGAPARLAEAQALLASMPTDALAERGPLPAGSRMPLAANPLFVGRGDELLRVARALRGGDTTVALGQVVASTGLGGLGKTQLAVELVHRYGRFFAGGVFWLSFASAEEIPLQVAACAAPGLEARPLEERVRRVKDAWQSSVPRLLVFDNCEEEALLDAWRPSSGGCRVLVTSRRAHWSPTLGARTLQLDVLPRLDSIDLLRRYRPDLALDNAKLDAIAHELGDLPLALHLAGSYLRAYRAEVTIDQYLVELRRSEVVQHASLRGAGLDESVSPTHHEQSVAQTLALCLGRLDRDQEVDRVAIALLARMASMAPGEPVPRELLARTLEDVSPLRQSDGLRRLGALGLVEEGGGWLRQHRLVGHLVRGEALDPEASQAVDHMLIACGLAADEGLLTGSPLAAIIPHLVHAAGKARDNADEEERAGQFHFAVAAAMQRTTTYFNKRRGQTAWLERVDAVHDSLRAALVWCRGHDQASLVRLTLALVLFWLTGGHLDEGDEWLHVILTLPSLAPPDRARAVYWLGRISLWQGEYDVARRRAEAGLVAYLALGDAVGAGWSLNLIGTAHLYAGDKELAVTCFEEVMATVTDDAVRIDTLTTIGELRLLEGDVLGAREVLERALAEGGGPEGRFLVADAVFLLSIADFLDREYGRARERLDEALDAFQLAGNRYSLAGALCVAGALALAAGTPEPALRLYGAAMAMRDTIRAPLASGWQELVRTVVLEPARALVGPARADAVVAAGACMSAEEVMSEARHRHRASGAADGG